MPCGPHAPYCLKDYQEQPGTGLYLPGVSTLVYTAGNDEREARVRSILSAFRFRNWSFFRGQRTARYWETIPGDHAAMLRAHQPPLLILEDDIEPRLFRAWVDPPPMAQIAMLGGGRGGDRVGIRNAVQHGHHPKRWQRWAYEDIPGWPDWFRVYGMWYTHAYLYLDRGAMLEMAELLAHGGQAVDTIQARNQYRWFVACARVPWFWQNDGHHYPCTYDYEPRAVPFLPAVNQPPGWELPTPEPTRPLTRLERIRAERHAVARRCR